MGSKGAKNASKGLHYGLKFFLSKATSWLFSTILMWYYSIFILWQSSHHPRIDILWNHIWKKNATSKSSWTHCALCHAKHLDMSIEWSESEIGMQIAMHNRESSWYTIGSNCFEVAFKSSKLFCLDFQSWTG